MKKFMVYREYMDVSIASIVRGHSIWKVPTFPEKSCGTMLIVVGNSGISIMGVARLSNLITAIPFSFGGWFVKMGSPWQGLLQHSWSIRSLLKRCASKSWQPFMTGGKRF